MRFDSPLNEFSSSTQVLLGLGRGEKHVEMITVQENIIVGNFCFRTRATKRVQTFPGRVGAGLRGR